MGNFLAFRKIDLKNNGFQFNRKINYSLIVNNKH